MTFSACSGEQMEQGVEQKNEFFSLQIVDSLQIDYLGQLYMVDQNSKGQFLLQDPQRNSFMVADEKGNIINEFVINEDDKDYPGISFESPAFYKDDQIVFNAAKGLHFFDFNGTLQFKTDEPLESSVFISRLGTKALFEINWGGRNFLLTNRLGFLGGDPNSQDFYDSFRALNRFNPETQAMEAFVPLAQESIFQDGKYHSSSRLLNRFDIEGQQIALVYAKDPHAYLYEMSGDSLILKKTISLSNEVLYLDSQKERLEPVKAGETRVVSGSPLSSFQMKMGESSVRNVALLPDNLLMVQYNPGLPEDLRQEAKIVQDGGAIRIESPDNIPRDYFVVFKDGNKAGGGELPSQLKSFIFEKDGFLWFSGEPNEDVEEDFVTWYKLKLSNLKE
jgi:hypothetical protein